VGIFRRGTKDTSTDSGASQAIEDTTADDEVSGTDSATTAETAQAPVTPERSENGPFDRSEVESLDGRLDLGALWLMGVPGMELRLEVEEGSEHVVAVTAALEESTVHLQAFAAPRTEGIWDEIRTELAASITGQGGTADKRWGPLGNELRAQMPSQNPDGRTVFSPVRFLGVDGPRWFLRAVLSGPAATDDSAASTLLDVVRATVVVRGDEAMAPREVLPLKLPEQFEGQPGADEDAAGPEVSDEQTPSLDEFKPFARGPEITEIH
jgi:Protein of unknown function (DUF3710)